MTQNKQSENIYTLEKGKENKEFYIYDSINEILSKIFPIIEEDKMNICEEIFKLLYLLNFLGKN